MCRYGLKKYKSHFVCFDCRKTFKQVLTSDIIRQNGEENAYKMAFLESRERLKKQNSKLVAALEEKYHNRKYTCPDCGQEMCDIGKDFKAPPKHKKKAWEIVRALYQSGRTFHSCGCYGPGYIPRSRRAYIEYLEGITGHKRRSIKKELGRKVS